MASPRKFDPKEEQMRSPVVSINFRDTIGKAYLRVLVAGHSHTWLC